MWSEKQVNKKEMKGEESGCSSLENLEDTVCL